jgi:hypothetical protein
MSAPSNFTPPKWFRPIEVGATYAFAAALGGYFWIQGMEGTSIEWGAILVGYVAADFLSGLVHWACDRLGSERTPLVGPAIIRAFREHHVDPLSITRHDFFEVNGSNALATLPVWFLIGGDLLGLWSIRPDWSQFLLSLAVFTVLTNQIHCWAHTLNPPWPVRQLQRAGLILSPQMHARHHSAPYESTYCITAGWWNLVLDRAAFWRRLELWVVPRRLISPKQ